MSKLVKSVIITEEDIDMYDVCNTERGCFVADGLITHNSAADMSKLALIKLRNDEELKKRQVRPIIPVHDEILIEVPIRYAKYVKDRFAYDMETAAQPRLTIPVSCDVTSAERWYGDELDLDEATNHLPTC